MLWSWGESNPRPSGGGRTRYDHSRRRGCHSLTGGSVDRLTSRCGGPRSVFPECQRSFLPSAVFPAAIPRFCCRAAMEWPRAALLLTIFLSQPEDQAATANCSDLAILLGAPFYESEQLGSHARPASLTSKPVSPAVGRNSLPGRRSVQRDDCAGPQSRSARPSRRRIRVTPRPPRSRAGRARRAPGSAPRRPPRRCARPRPGRPSPRPA